MPDTPMRTEARLARWEAQDHPHGADYQRQLDAQEAVMEDRRGY